MYNLMIKEICSPHMTSEVYSTVQNCHICAQNRTKGKRHQLLIAIFPKVSLEYRNRRNRSITEKKGNQRVVLTVDQYTELNKAILTSRTQVTSVARILLERCVASFAILSKLVANNGLKLVSKILKLFAVFKGD